MQLSKETQEYIKYLKQRYKPMMPVITDAMLGSHLHHTTASDTVRSKPQFTPCIGTDNTLADCSNPHNAISSAQVDSHKKAERSDAVS